jgi:uncharacterized protein (DUF433 family)
LSYYIVMIECNPAINFGMPALKGRRLTVYDIVTKIYYEESVPAALEDYSISLDDAKDAIHYCVSLKCKEDPELVQFCDGCILRTIHEGWDFDKQNYIETEENGQKITVSKNGKIIFLGSLKEFEDSEFGKVGWLLAEKVNKLLLQA